jgi:hypothetical protein
MELNPEEGDIAHVRYQGGYTKQHIIGKITPAGFYVKQEHEKEILGFRKRFIKANHIAKLEKGKTHKIHDLMNL